MRYPSPSHLSRSRSLQPRLQKGACSGASGFPQSGQDFDCLDAFCISAEDGNGGVAPQLDRAADLGRQGGDPVDPAL